MCIAQDSDFAPVIGSDSDDDGDGGGGSGSKEGAEVCSQRHSTVYVSEGMTLLRCGGKPKF